ncbi:hypothetical protein [Propionimicrobium sp. PCR01-08-3]|uniref:hypothetical protein n=1 Tax=Propionimicrobium sp. PCR01-08-3 TaxID=3052086 RepID=UPI00255CA741|nr:hypothetical protein [Propionimicrobium sp. PCR01-08-3]WIY83599.1 hypothetical protein QQ658_04380 [Propionimicrobium sp. PCR01-08-3]
MATQVYKTLSKIVGVVLLVLGIAALVGGNFAHSYVSEQLADQNITMATDESIDGQLKAGRISEDDAAALRKYAGQEMLTGPQAETFANHYIHAHMAAAAKAAGVPDDQANYSAIGSLVTQYTNDLQEELKALPENADKSDAEIAALADEEIANPNTTYENAKQAATLQELRMDTFLDGNTLRGMLLNAYGWWLVGTIAQAAGWALIVIGIALGAFGFILKDKTAKTDTASA